MTPQLPETLPSIPRVRMVKPSPHVGDLHDACDRCPTHGAGLFRLKDEYGRPGQARACHFGCLLELDSYKSLLPGV